MSPKHCFRNRSTFLYIFIYHRSDKLFFASTWEWPGATRQCQHAMVLTQNLLLYAFPVSLYDRRQCPLQEGERGTCPQTSLNFNITPMGISRIEWNSKCLRLLSFTRDNRVRVDQLNQTSHQISMSAYAMTFVHCPRPVTLPLTRATRTPMQHPHSSPSTTPRLSKPL